MITLYRVDVFTESGMHSFCVHNTTSWFENDDGIVFVNGDQVVSTLKLSASHSVVITSGSITHDHEK